MVLEISVTQLHYNKERRNSLNDFPPVGKDLNDIWMTGGADPSNGSLLSLDILGWYGVLLFYYFARICPDFSIGNVAEIPQTPAVGCLKHAQPGLALSKARQTSLVGSLNCPRHTL